MSWIETRSGATVDLMDPKAASINIEDIAFALSNICRFVGHVDFYSVAQHSVLVSLASGPYPIHGLLHDAEETYIGDISHPLKQVLDAEYKTKYLLRDLKERLCLAIGEALAVPDFGAREASWHPVVKAADLRALATERRDLMPKTGNTWPLLEDVAPFTETIVPLPPADARELFLARWRSLMGGVP